MLRYRQIPQLPQLDGDIDNSIIAHEYMHGISGRLTGGPTKTTYCLQNKEQMGEGWSDYMALMMTTDWTTATTTDGALPRAIGNYAAGLPVTGAGIRIYPYTTIQSINPWTYDSLATSSYMTEVHNVGEPWCDMLWDMTWSLINSAGINRNFFNANGAGGNSVALKLVMQGLKLQPCAVGFVTGRNAILLLILSCMAVSTAPLSGRLLPTVVVVIVQKKANLQP